MVVPLMLFIALEGKKLVFPLHLVAAAGLVPGERLSASRHPSPSFSGILVLVPIQGGYCLRSTPNLTASNLQMAKRDLHTTSIRQAHHNRLRASHRVEECFVF